MLNNIFDERINGNLGFSETKRQKFQCGEGCKGEFKLTYNLLKVTIYTNQKVSNFEENVIK